MEVTANKTHCETYWEKEELSFLWEIRDFSLYTYEQNTLESIDFGSPSNPQTKWYLMVLLFGPGNNKYVTPYLYLKYTTDSLKSPKVNVTISIVNKNNQECSTSKCNFTFAQVESCHSFQKFISRNDLLQSEDLLPNDTLTLSCKVVVYIRKQTKQIHEIAPEDSGFEIQPNFLSLLETQIFSDVTLVVDGKEIAAHKNILSVHSDVFLAMFNTHMTEQKTNRVEIKDLSFETVEEMLSYCYSGQVPPYGATTEALIQAADKYNVKSLLCEIENQIIKQVTLSNACDLLILSNMYHLTKATEFLKRFLFVDHFTYFKINNFV